MNSETLIRLNGFFWDTRVPLISGSTNPDFHRKLDDNILFTKRVSTLIRLPGMFDSGPEGLLRWRRENAVIKGRNKRIANSALT